MLLEVRCRELTSLSSKGLSTASEVKDHFGLISKYYRSIQASKFENYSALKLIDIETGFYNKMEPRVHGKATKGKLLVKPIVRLYNIAVQKFPSSNDIVSKFVLFCVKENLVKELQSCIKTVLLPNSYNSDFYITLFRGFKSFKLCDPLAIRSILLKAVKSHPKEPALWEYLVYFELEVFITPIGILDSILQECYEFMPEDVVRRLKPV